MTKASYDEWMAAEDALLDLWGSLAKTPQCERPRLYDAIQQAAEKCKETRQTHCLRINGYTGRR